MRDYGVQIVGRTAVIKSHETIRLSAAAAKVPAQRVPAHLIEGPRHPEDVAALRAALETVRKEGEALRADSRPIEVEKILVRRRDPFTLIYRSGISAHETR